MSAQTSTRPAVRRITFNDFLLEAQRNRIAGRPAELAWRQIVQAAKRSRFKLNLAKDEYVTVAQLTAMTAASSKPYSGPASADSWQNALKVAGKLLAKKS